MGMHMDADKPAWLDRPALSAAALTREKALYGLLIALAVLSRLWDLGYHVMSHDEMIHSLWSWYLYQGQGYSHHPLSHGPFLYHATALVYSMFGDSDFTARLVPALMGVALVGLPYAFRRWLGRTGALAAAFLFLISPSLLYYSRYIRHDVPVVVWAVVAAWAILTYLENHRQSTNQQINKPLLILSASLALMLATMEVAFFYIAMFGMFLVVWFFTSLTKAQWAKMLLVAGALLAVLLLAMSLLLLGLHGVGLFPVTDVVQPASFEMTITIGLIAILTVLTGVCVYVALDRRMPFRAGERPALDLIVVIGCFTLPSLSAIPINGLSRLVSRLFFGINAAFYALDYSPAGLLRSAGFVFILLATAVAVGLWWDWRRWLVSAAVFYAIFILLFTTFFTNGNGLASGLVGSLGYWLEQQAVERGSQPLYYYALLAPLYEYLPLMGFAGALAYALVRGLRGASSQRLFVRFVLSWGLLTWPIYTLAGERMPWLIVHFAAPMILASGWAVGKWVEGVDWLFAIRYSLFGYWAWQRIDLAGLGHTLAALGLAVLAGLTVRTAWTAAYINADYVTEFLFFAHSTPDMRHVVEQLKDISQRTVGEYELDIGFTSDGSYPLRWYIRHYPNAVQIPNPPGRPDLEKSVLIAGDKEWGGVQPYLGDHYLCHRYIYMWWPMQDYWGLTWERVRYALVNPHMRAAVWDIIFRRDYRRYERVTGKTVRVSEWPLREGIHFCVRRDVIARLWGESAGLASSAPAPDWPAYAGLEQPAVVELKIESSGAAGAFNAPHGLAQDAEGFVYVADTNNHRIVKLSAAGEWVDTWDSTWWHGLESWQPNGCLDAAGRPLALGDGQFCEPWGVAVGPTGRVYVADTWNHRVQVFDAEGGFLGQVGVFGQSGSDATSAPGQFYGPRDVAVDRQGRVYVSDTGNKRIQVLDSALNYLYSFGGPGIAAGRLDEPVGLSIGPDNLLYVADTWNRRVQVFTPGGQLVREWPVDGWAGQSAANKPYLAVDRAGRVYASDPEGRRIIVFDAAGEPLAVLYRDAASPWQLPTGLLLDAQDRLWVSDAAAQRLLRLAALN